MPGLLDRLAEHPDVVLETFDEDVLQDDFAGLTADYDVVVAHRSDDVVPPQRDGLEVRLLLREPSMSPCRWTTRSPGGTGSPRRT